MWLDKIQMDDMEVETLYFKDFEKRRKGLIQIMNPKTEKLEK